MTEEQRQEADARSAAELSQEMRAPLGSIDKRTGKMETGSPLFCGSAANPQGMLF
jgi:signal transduction histidine kinase